MRLFTTLCLATALLPAAAATPPLEKATSQSGGLREVNMRSMRTATMRRSPARELPASFPLSNQAEFNECLTVDGNGDGKTWKYEMSSACYEGIGVTIAADDWLILPAFAMPASGTVTVSLDAKQTYMAETFEVCISPTQNVADAVVILSVPTVDNNYKLYTADHTLSAAGEYYVMIHATTPSAGISLYVKNVNVTASVDEGFTVPFEMTPEPAETKYFTPIDSNGDGRTWSFDTSNIGFAYEAPSGSSVVADDYLLFPDITISEPGNYKFSWDCRGWGQSREGIEVLVGQGEDISTFRTLFRDTEVGSNVFRREVVFSVAEPGDYRMALHCISPANAYKLLTKNYRLEATDESPAAPLPAMFAQSWSVASTPVFTPPVIIPEDARLEFSFELEGDDVNVGMSNAPAANAVTNLFTATAANGDNVVKTFNFAGNGIRYLSFTSTGSSVVKNVSISLASETGEGYPLPFSMQPTAEEYLEFSAIDRNGDGSSWTYYEPFGAARYAYSTSSKGDDWLILPAINVASLDEMLRFALLARGMAVTLPETFEIWMGETPDPSAMTKLFDSPEIRTETFTPLEFSFSPQWLGTTYFAVRATSEPKMFHLFVRDFEIAADGRSTAIPRPVENVTATPLPRGSESATLTFTLPALAENGSPLDASVDLVANVTTRKATYQFTGKPGEQISREVENGQGDGEISIVVNNAAGSSNAYILSVYTGQDTPQAVNDLVVTAGPTNRTAHLEWTFSETGANGGYVDPAAVTFTIRHSTGSNSYTNVGTVTGTCEYDYTIPDSYPLEMHYFMIEPSNVAGSTPATKGTGVTLGRPYQIPAIEDFSNGVITLGPVGMAAPDSRYTLDWYFDNPANGFDEAANNSGHALIAFTEEYGPARGRLHLPKFDTRTDSGARLVVRVFNFPHFAPTDAYGLTAAGAPVFIGHIDPAQTPGWQEYSFPLPAELLNLQWVEAYLDFGFNGYFDDEIWMLDRYGMENYFDCELDLRKVTTFERMKAFDCYAWKFEVGNYGKTPLSFETPKLSFTSENGDVAQFDAQGQDATIALSPGESTLLTYNVALRTEMEGDVAYDIIIPIEGDGNAENNYLAGEATVWQQEEYVVRDLRAYRSEDERLVNLNWSAPQTDWGILYCDNLTSWERGSQIGLFQNYDGDKLSTNSFVGATYPAMGVPKAWQVFDYQDAGFDYIYAGYLASTKSLIVFAPIDGRFAADDWLISPEIKGGTLLTFYLRPLHFAYGSETVEILTSSTGTDIADFSLLSTYQTAQGDPTATPYWEEVEVTLPQDARYFAIRYASKDIFGLQMDDIIYTPAQQEENDLRYTILRNGEVIASGLTDTYFAHETLAAGTYQIAAEKAYGGLHPLGNAVFVEGASGLGSLSADTFKVSGHRGYLAIQGAEGRRVDVLTPDGKIVYSNPAAPASLEVPLAEGLYIVNTNGQPAAKAIVR